ncbi:interleukin-2 receptor subunit beta [Scomber scombrus]|uniref:Interleukin-2 receptor subunit beta n=1 Tax=Scomber scombrus TaxID=13677 RepID=A0AAV1Q2M4_SCOSC|nr:interleukin-2 receptor subunit beta [Scomber scombrus]
MSRIVVMVMEMLWSLYMLVVLFSVHAAHSHKDSQGLSCVNDLVNNVTCTWDGSLKDPGVDCWISGLKQTTIVTDDGRKTVTIIRSCKLKQYKDSPPGCSFVFEKNKFNTFESMPNISMECNGTLLDYLTKYKPVEHIQMQPPGAPNVNCTGNEISISWSLDSLTSQFLKSFDFQVQIKRNHQTWETFSTPEQELQLQMQMKGVCLVRVRVMPFDRQHSHWSKWSPTTECQGTEREEPFPGHHSVSESWSGLRQFLIPSLVFIIIVLAVLYWICVSKILAREPVPNPSKYFHTLHSVHGGNLKTWLNPLSAPESFFTAQPCDEISAVKVGESWDVAPSTSPSSSALLHFRSYPSAGSDTSGVVDNSSSSVSSGFSNMGYFMSSSSSSSARTDPSSDYFTYKEDLRNSQNSHNLRLSLCPLLTTSQTYESLKREPHSPDSGFGIGEEEEEDKDDNSDVTGEEVSDDHQSAPFLILPLHLPSWMCPATIPPPPLHPPSLTQISSESQQVDVTVAAANGSYAAWPVAGAMYRSSSMPVEPCKTGYLTLKELQTTFSNKSI